MINIKELASGNWVYATRITKKPVQIEGIIEREGYGSKGYTFTLRTQDNDLIVRERMQFIEPIEITPEILEKNGWKLGKYSSATLVLEDKIVVVEFYESGTQLRIFKRAEDEDLQILDIRISGVHQLQNALTLCAINKEIELL